MRFDNISIVTTVDWGWSSALYVLFRKTLFVLNGYRTSFQTIKTDDFD